MGQAFYEVVARGPQFFVLHDGHEAGPYLTKEAAFEAAVPPASLSIADGHEVVIRVEPGMKDPLNADTPQRL